MGKALSFLAAFVCTMCFSSTASAAPPADYQLTFSDEFDGSALDTSKWIDHYKWATSLAGSTVINGELEAYVDNAFQEQNSILSIVGQKQQGSYAGQTMNYTSGIICSSFHQKYGYRQLRPRLHPCIPIRRWHRRRFERHARHGFGRGRRHEREAGGRIGRLVGRNDLVRRSDLIRRNDLVRRSDLLRRNNLLGRQCVRERRGRPGLSFDEQRQRLRMRVGPNHERPGAVPSPRVGRPARPRPPTPLAAPPPLPAPSEF